MIYFVEATGIGNIKIGFTDGESAESRLACLQTGSPCPLRLLGTIPGTMEDEKNMHRRFASDRVCGEWFKPNKELLALIPVGFPDPVGDVQIAEQSISIRVLTVGRKKFTEALLRQLPLASDVNDVHGGNVWGRIHEKSAGYGARCRWIIFESHGSLYRYHDTYIRRNDVEYRQSIEDSESISDLLGCRFEDQLFVGI